MAKLEIQQHYDGPDYRYHEAKQVKVTLSRRNLLALLHKLDMEGSNRRLENNVVYFGGELSDDYVLVLCCEDDAEHYNDPDRLDGQNKPGPMHHETEAYIRLGTNHDES